MPPTWTIYGFRNSGVDNKGLVTRAPLHGEGFLSEADATLWLMDHVIKHGAGGVHAVVVKLDKGDDVNGQRHVIRRIGDGRAWWE